ncbi:hypothetical protein ACLK19_23435 [Escherichia coli]
MHGSCTTRVADLVLIVLSIVVTIVFFRQAFKLDKTGRNKMFVAFVLMLKRWCFTFSDARDANIAELLCHEQRAS